MFWHKPVRAERLALTRILLAFALLTDQLVEYLPHLLDFYGPAGAAPAGLVDERFLRQWFWTLTVFNTDDPTWIYVIFSLWVAFTVGWLAGFWTRVMNVGVWLLTMCFLYRNPGLLNGGDDTLQVGIFLLLLSPCGRALSIDAWRRQRRQDFTGSERYIVPWPVRLFQIQLCMIYLTSGLSKLEGDFDGTPETLFHGTWWEGSSIHYVLNYITMSRWSFAQLPLPFWLTATMTYTCLAFEILFPLLVLFRWTRGPALWFGLLFHLGIWLTIEVGWFSFYTMALYGVWVPCRFWQRWDRESLDATTSGHHASGAINPALQSQ